MGGGGGVEEEAGEAFEEGGLRLREGKGGEGGKGGGKEGKESMSMMKWRQTMQSQLNTGETRPSLPPSFSIPVRPRSWAAAEDEPRGAQ